MPLSDMRYTHLVIEAGVLLAELRSLGATFEDCERGKLLVDNATIATIGRVIHDLQSQVHDLDRVNAELGIDPNCFNDDYEEDYLYGRN